jgi:hypothetical protein
MIQIDEKITQIPNFNENCLWLLFKMTQVKMNYENTHPKLATLEKWTGWEKKKILRVIDLLVSLDLLKVEKRWKKNGGQNSNEYKITTKMLSYIVGADGTTFVDEIDENNESQNGTFNESQNGRGDESQNGTDNIVNSNSLETTTYQVNQKIETSKKDQLKSIIQNSFYQSSLDRFNLSPEELDYTIDEVIIKHPEIEVELLAKKVFSFAPYSKINYQNFKKAQELAIKGNELKEQRVQDYHAKKMENIAKIGSLPSWDKKEPTQTYTNTVDIYQEEGETDQDFDERVEQRQIMTGSNYNKKYTSKNTTTFDFNRLKASLSNKFKSD